MKWLEYGKANITREQRLRANEIRDYYLSSTKVIVSRQVSNISKISQSQRAVIDGLAYDMFKHSLGRDYINTHYEIFQECNPTDPNYDVYEIERNQNIYLTHTSSSTLIALARRGFIEIIEDAGRGIDRVKVLFNLCFSEIKLTEAE